MTVVHLINVFEAYIDRHLINFDYSEDLTLESHHNRPLSEWNDRDIRYQKIVSIKIPIGR